MNGAMFLAQMSAYADLYPINKSDTHIQYKFILPDYHLDQNQWIPNWALTSEPGKPQLPQTGFLFQTNVPISIDIIELNETQFDVENVLPSPIISNAKFKYATDKQTYETDQFYPSQIFSISSPSKWSNTNIVRIIIRPFQWNPVTKKLRIIHQMTFSIHWKNKESHRNKQNRSYKIDPIKFQIIMNYLPERTTTSEMRKKTNLLNPKLNISVKKNSIYCLTYQDLEINQFPVSQKPAVYLQLWHIDKQIPLHINGEESYLQNGDSIEFYGQKIDSPYTHINVYQLSWGDLPGLRMQTKTASPNQNSFSEYVYRTAIFEKNLSDCFWPATPGAPEADFVFWDLLIAPDSFSTTFDLPGLNTLVPNIPTHMRIVFQEKTDSLHNIKILLNDRDVFQNQFHDDSHFQLDIPLDTHLFKAQNNTLTIQTELSSGIWADKLYINKFSIRYPSTRIALNNMAIIETEDVAQNIEISGFTTRSIRIFDISNPTMPELFTAPIIGDLSTNFHIQFLNQKANTLLICTNSSLITPEVQWASNEPLQSTENCADYVIITPQKFVSAVQPLIDYYSLQGIRTMTVSPITIYDLFNGGIVNPLAVRNFLAYAYNHWERPPNDVLMLGDSNIDYLDYFQTGKQNEVPVYLSYMDGVGLAPNDHYFVCVEGDDLYPEMSIGRIPGKDVADIENQIIKRLNYSKAMNTTRQRNLFISDNSPDNIFAKICENSLGYLSDRMEQIHLKLINSADVDILTGQMYDYLNSGILIATYMGHGSIDNWAREPIMHSDDINRIGPNTPLTFFISLNCMSGYFALPDRYSLSQKLIMPENKGAIAVFAPTAMAQITEIDTIAQALFSLIRSNPNIPVGDLVQGAKMAAFAKGVRESTIQMFTLTGDPLLKLNLPNMNFLGDFDSDGHLTLKDILILIQELGGAF
jgi:hypothetical protein